MTFRPVPQSADRTLKSSVYFRFTFARVFFIETVSNVLNKALNEILNEALNRALDKALGGALNEALGGTLGGTLNGAYMEH